MFKHTGSPKNSCERVSASGQFIPPWKASPCSSPGQPTWATPDLEAEKAQWDQASVPTHRAGAAGGTQRGRGGAGRGRAQQPAPPRLAPPLLRSGPALVPRRAAPPFGPGPEAPPPGDVTGQASRRHFESGVACPCLPPAVAGWRKREREPGSPGARSLSHRAAGSARSARPSFLPPAPFAPARAPRGCHPPPSALSTPPSAGEGGESGKRRPRGTQQGHHLQRNMAGKGEISRALSPGSRRAIASFLLPPSPPSDRRAPLAAPRGARPPPPPRVSGNWSRGVAWGGGGGGRGSGARWLSERGRAGPGWRGGGGEGAGVGGVGRRVGAVQGRLVAQLCTLSPPRPLPLFCFHFNCPIVLTFNSCFFFFDFLSPSAQPFFLGYFFFFIPDLP